MKLANHLIAIVLALASCLLPSVVPAGTAGGPIALSNCVARVAFSPNGGASDLVLQTIGSARKTIRVAGYYFFDARIGKALLDASRRGVDVRVVLDKDHNAAKPGPSVASYLAERGIQVAITSAYRIQHNKVVVVDGETVETGSYNYTKGADLDNAENVLVIGRCPQLAAVYLADWEKLRASTTSRISGG